MIAVVANAMRRSPVASGPIVLTVGGSACPAVEVTFGPVATPVGGSRLKCEGEGVVVDQIRAAAAVMPQPRSWQQLSAVGKGWTA